MLAQIEVEAQSLPALTRVQLLDAVTADRQVLLDVGADDPLLDHLLLDVGPLAEDDRLGLDVDGLGLDDPLDHSDLLDRGIALDGLHGLDRAILEVRRARIALDVGHAIGREGRRRREREQGESESEETHQLAPFCWQAFRAEAIASASSAIQARRAE